MSDILLSIIIPSYGDKKCIVRAVESIVTNRYTVIDTDRIEIIIVFDKCSNEFINETKEKFNEFNMQIHYHNTDGISIHCPGNSRQIGLDNAVGEYVTFLDHDDMFTMTAIDMFATAIKDSEPYLIRSNFYEMYGSFYNPYVDNSQPDLHTTRLFNIDNGKYWLHGKFYNRKFLMDYDIRFMTDLVRYEDMYFNVMTYMHIIGLDLNDDIHDIVSAYSYIYTIPEHIQDSFSKSYFTDDMYKSYLEEEFKSSVLPWVTGAEMYPNKQRIYFTNCVRGLVTEYVFQMICQQRPYYDKIFHDKTYIPSIIDGICKKFNVSRDVICEEMNPEDAEYEMHVLERLHGHIDITMTFEEFIYQ